MKKLLSFILAVLMVMSIIPLTASAEEISGTCGENLTWMFDESAGTLTISGTGDMDNYDYYDNRPWESYVHLIKRVIIIYGVTSIGDRAFDWCKSITGITIPNSIISIGNYAFAFCDSLTDIIIPDSVTSIGNYAFEYCNNLNDITVDKNNLNYSSDDCGVLFNKEQTILIQYPLGNKRASYTIPDNVTSIGNYAFVSCNRLTSIIISNSVLSIGDQAFNQCDNLTSITIPNSVKNVGYCAFSDCKSLTDVYYSGTEEQWNEIEFDEYNKALLNANIHYNYMPDTPSVKSGDANGDGKVTAIDARVTLQAAAGLEPLTDDLIKVLDMNNDGKVTAIDARWILQISAGLR